MKTAIRNYLNKMLQNLHKLKWLLYCGSRCIMCMHVCDAEQLCVVVKVFATWCPILS